MSTPLERARRCAERALRLEAATVALAPSFGVLGVWLAFSLLGAPLLVPPLLLAPLTLLAFGAAAALGWQRARALPTPHANAIDRRIERVSVLPHRPLGTLRDVPAGQLSPDTAALWATHQARVAASLDRLRPVWPAPALAPIDPWRLRFAIPALVVCGLLLAGSDGSDRLLASLLPGIVPVPGPAGRLQAWITPPTFSDQAPIFLHPGETPPALPAGALLTVDLGGSDAIPRVLTGGAGPATRFHLLAPGSWQATVRLNASGTLRVRQGGHRIAAWPFTVTTILAPDVAWAGEPGPWRHGWRTGLPWQVRDRYGVVGLSAELRPLRPAGAPPIRLTIPLGGAPRSASGIELPDLSASPFAGTAVEAVLIARNGAGRDGRSRAARFTLPMRPFHDPLARALIGVRQRLALDPDGRAAAARDLAALGAVPHAFDDRAGLFLNLESVAALLTVDPDAGAIDQAEARLWQLALQIEDGAREGSAPARTALALQAARDAVDRQIARMRSLGARGHGAADQAELARRLQRLRAALAARFGALMREAARNGLALPPDAARALGASSLGRMLGAVSSAAEAGRMDQAERQLSQLEDMLDRMRPATDADIRRAAASMQAREAAAAQAAAVADMVQRQAALIDRAARRTAPSTHGGGDQASSPLSFGGFGAPAPAPAPSGAPSPPSGDDTAESPTSPSIPGGDTTAGAASAAETGAREADRRTENALARAADALAEQAASLSGKRPDALGRASVAMRGAAKGLAAGDDRAAGASELEALRDLQQGSRQMQQAAKNASGAGGGAEALIPGLGPGEDDVGDGGDDGQSASSGEQDGGNRDPLGRAITGRGDGNADDTELAIPGDAANAQSRAIEEELRRRDSDRQRPRDELDYLGRLLQPF